MKTKIFCCFLCLLFVSACDDVSQQDRQTKEQVKKVYGELFSSESQVFQAPKIENFWKYSIAYMAPEGTWVEKGDVVLSFDDKELKDRLRVDNNKLSEEQKKLEKQKIKNEETIEKALLAVAERKMLLDKVEAKLKHVGSHTADIKIKELKIDYQAAVEIYDLMKKKLELTQKLAKNQVDIISGNIKRKELEVQQTKDGIKKLKMLAGNAGLVTYLQKRNSAETYTIGDEAWFGVRVIELPNLNHLKVRLFVAEQLSPDLKIGQKVELVMEANREKKYYGKITAIGNILKEQSTTQLNKGVDVIVSLDELDLDIMRPGMPVRALLIDSVGSES